MEMLLQGGEREGEELCVSEYVSQTVALAWPLTVCGFRLGGESTVCVSLGWLLL